MKAGCLRWLGLLDYSLEQAWNHTRAQLLEHLYYSFKYRSIIIHYNLSTPTDELIFIDLHVQFTCTPLLLVGLSSESHVTVIHGTQTFTVAGSALRCKANLYTSFYELSRANAICFKQELEHRTTTLMCTFLIKEPSRLLGCTYIVSVQLCISSGSKRKSDFVRVNTDVLALYRVHTDKHV